MQIFPAAPAYLLACQHAHTCRRSRKEGRGCLLAVHDGGIAALVHRSAVVTSGPSAGLQAVSCMYVGRLYVYVALCTYRLSVAAGKTSRNYVLVHTYVDQASLTSE